MLRLEAELGAEPKMLCDLSSFPENYVSSLVR